uniref:NADH dehydrogenase subunit 5 n=1 Tax=Cocculina enigmadonta TaxID=2729702 RepID=UPI00220C7B1B|nr:NADH dehydrogenase subunit 5 [Cocculina enigmadonta]UXN84351.1 NADH dehydrogenase subunit 5 [Cocculina enigmadonta]
MVGNSSAVKSSSISSCFLFFYCFFICPFLLYIVLTNGCQIIEWEMLSMSSCLISVPFILDPVGVSFSFVVCFISGCVMLFSSFYMASEVFLSRFIWLVMLFVFSMNALIFIPSSIALLLGWDGLGIVSFVLVVFYQNNKSLGAGMLTALANRVGDVALLTGIGLALSGGHWNILFFDSSEYLGGLAVCIMLAGMTKSAQVPFCSWLPAAMAAPTPVSALVHSSTLVTAGVFLLIRFYYFISVWEYFNVVLIFISVVTLVLAGIGASYEFDLKKVIALSTLSQLGVMMMSLGLGFPMLALFHLFTHALFKAMLFLCAGSIIHSSGDIQDLRLLGGLWKDMPVTVSCLNVANLALCGAPFVGGFYSKDLILEMMMFSPCNMFIIFMGLLATGLTCLYSLRLSYYSLWGVMGRLSLGSPSDENLSCSFSMIFLTILTIFGSLIIQESIIGFSEVIIIPILYKMSIFFVIGVGGFLAFLIVEKSMVKESYGSASTNFFSLMWFFSLLSTHPFSFLVMKGGETMFKQLDHGWLEVIGGKGVFNSVKFVSKMNQEVQKSIINSFIFSMFFMFLCLFVVFMM